MRSDSVTCNSMATPEVKLARKLASNDLESRRAAEKTLRDWLSHKATDSFSEIEMRRLWKGLFSCMFMSDKPLVQEQLATDLSLLVHLFPQYNRGIMFCTIFFDAMASEWHGIDRLRLDKFYMKIYSRDVCLFASSSCVNEIMEKLISFDKKCYGLLLHVSEVFLPELSLLRSKISEDVSLMLLSPWIQLVATSKNVCLVQVIQKNVLDKLVKEHKIKRLTINWSKLNEFVWEWLAKPEILTRNRKTLQSFYTEINEKVEASNNDERT